MIETPFGNIHGIDDETITMLDLRNLFKAIEKGMVFQITYREETKPYKSRSFEVSKVVRCKDCKWKKWADVDDEIVFCKLHGTGHNLDWFCADGEPKEGGSNG